MTSDRNSNSGSKFVRLVPRFTVNNTELAQSFYKSLGFEVDYNDGGLTIMKSDGEICIFTTTLIRLQAIMSGGLR